MVPPMDRTPVSASRSVNEKTSCSISFCPKSCVRILEEVCARYCGLGAPSPSFEPDLDKVCRDVLSGWQTGKLSRICALENAL